MRSISALAVGDRDARLQPRQSNAAEARARRGHVEAHGQNQIHGKPAEREARGHHTDHFARRAVDRDRAPDHARIAAEAALPVTVAQDRGFRRVGLIVVARNRSAERGLNVQNPQGACRHEQRVDLLGITEARDRRLARPIHSQFLEGLAARRMELQHLLVEREVVAAHVSGQARVHHRHDGFRFRIRKGFDDDCIDDAEDGRRRADPQRQRQHDGERKCRPPPEATQRMAQIATDGIEEPVELHAVVSQANASSRQWPQSRKAISVPSIGRDNSLIRLERRRSSLGGSSHIRAGHPARGTGDQLARSSDPALIKVASRAASTGFVRCSSKPASFAFSLSSRWPRPVRAMSTISVPPSIDRMRLATS